MIASFDGNYVYNYNTTPPGSGRLVQSDAPETGAVNYQWQQSAEPVNGFTNISGATTASYTFPSTPLSQTTYYRQKVTDVLTGNFIYSNVVKIEVVSVNWENQTYIREHLILKPGVTDWKTIDQLPVGIENKMQTTAYIDGLGRSEQKVSCGTAAVGSLWGDVVQLSVYDDQGRQSKKYLPYTTTANSGKKKTDPVTDQATYYTNAYQESSAFSQVSVYDNSPLNRARQVKMPGTNWAASANGTQISYELNTTADNVQIFSLQREDEEVDIPSHYGIYAANTLYKNRYKDENNKQVIEFTNKSGQLILRKVQEADSPSDGDDGWLCSYSIYDAHGLLRFTLSPEAVKYFDQNGYTGASFNDFYDWGASDFSSYKDNLSDIQNELCSVYAYDEKRRLVFKKTPGAEALYMLYDTRDRQVFTQDGNQRNANQWMATLYDDLDRGVITTLYNTTSSIPQLQTDIAAATTITTITTSTPATAITDLVVDTRDVSVPVYSASNSIKLVPGFVSTAGDQFDAKIDPGATTSPANIPVTTLFNPISSTNLNDPGVCTILKYFFYDNYNFDGKKSFNTNFNNTAAYPSNSTTILPINWSPRTLGYPTGSKTRILNTNTFLNATLYYDELDGRLIQTNEDNIKAGTDIATYQYHFDGRLLSKYSLHTAAGTDYTQFGILTRNNFDNIGRTTSIDKQYGTNAWKTIATYTYDDLGRLSTTTLAPGYNNTTTGNSYLEKLQYSYNLHGDITGINKDYALKTSFNKWSNYFGQCLGFDKTEGVFNNTNLSGQVAGNVWTTQGDDAQRKYEYSYDNANRLSNAFFNEKKTTGDSWSHATMDFSVSGSANNKIEYDKNGNLTVLSQRGVIIGNSSPVTIDDLTYTYYTNSNRLKKVTDANTAPTNGQLGDFKGTANGSDYDHDSNGNIDDDETKSAYDIEYNYLDKPTIVKIDGKGILQYVYDANGTRLQKLFTPEGGTTTKITSYINGFVYEETKTLPTNAQASLGGGGTLQYINFEEGRVRPVQAVAQSNATETFSVAGTITLPDGKQGTFDYFIRDYQSNTRMILTEETHTSSSTATMENADASRATYEESIFGQPGGANEVATTRVTTVPSGWASNHSGAVSMLSKSSGHTVGPNSLLKVMAGDEMSAAVQYYFENPTTNTSTNSLAADIIASLAGALSGDPATIGTGLHNSATASVVTNNLDPTAIAGVADPNQYSTSLPRAYLTILFFDERFNYVAEGSTSQPVQTSGDGATPLVLANIKAPKNGYVYIYVSNESDEPVYFDNLQVQHVRGRIMEENHYYAFGLKIAGISSRELADAAEGHVDNPNGYQGDFSEMDDEIGWNDFELRNYDPQIGRWIQQDPYDQFESPYIGMGNDPVNNVDPDGGFVEGFLSSISTEMAAVACPSVEQAVKVVLTQAVISLVTQVTGVVARTATENMVSGKIQTQVGNQSNGGGNNQPQQPQQKKDSQSSSNSSTNTNAQKNPKTQKADPGPPGSYTITFKSGKKYHGKGPLSRAKQSAKQWADAKEDPAVSIDWTPSPDQRQAFKDEDTRLQKDGGHENPDNYNRRGSPGEKYKLQDGDNLQKTVQTTITMTYVLLTHITTLHKPDYSTPTYIPLSPGAAQTAGATGTSLLLLRLLMLAF